MKNALPLFENSDARDIAKRHCRSIAVPIRVLEALVEAEFDQVGKKTKRGIWQAFDEVLSEDDN